MVTYVQVTVVVLNVELCNSVSVNVLTQHETSVKYWMEYRKMY